MEMAKQIFTFYLRDEGIRYSQQRECILDVFLSTEKHLTVIDLYHLVQKKHSGIGYATVYRAIKIISQAGLAREVDFGDGMLRFEHKYKHEHHGHMICTKCGKFIEVVDPQIEELQEKLARKYKFTPQRHKMQIYGTCEKCKTKV